MFMALQLISVIIGSSEMWKYSHVNYPLLVPDVFGRVGGSFVREVIFNYSYMTSFWQKRIVVPSLVYVT